MFVPPWTGRVSDPRAQPESACRIITGIRKGRHVIETAASVIQKFNSRQHRQAERFRTIVVRHKGAQPTRSAMCRSLTTMPQHPALVARLSRSQEHALTLTRPPKRSVSVCFVLPSTGKFDRPIGNIAVKPRPSGGGATYVRRNKPRHSCVTYKYHNEPPSCIEYRDSTDFTLRMQHAQVVPWVLVFEVWYVGQQGGRVHRLSPVSTRT